MRTYGITAILNLSCDCIEFKEPFEINLKHKQIKKITLSSSPASINVNLAIESDSEEDAKELAYMHLNLLADKLAFNEGIVIKEVRITGMTCEEKRGKVLAVIATEFMHIKDEIAVRLIFPSKESTGRIKGFLEIDFPTEAQELLTMYKEAIAKEDNLSQYVLLYRILEKILGDKGEVDIWIKKEEPGVKTSYDQRIKKDRTVYSDLRNHIHPKQASFPHKEVSEYLPKLKELVKKAIKSHI